MRALPCLCLILWLCAVPHAHAQAADADSVNAANLLANERFWPYTVKLLEAWQPAEGKPALRAGTRGVLIRVESSGLARIDFGRAGLQDVPIASTNLLAGANRIRGGELPKPSPNFVTAIGSRLLDPTAETLQLFEVEQTARHRGFLCVFADPEAEGFTELAQALAPLRARDGVLTILFPQVAGSDARIAERLRALKWPVPFVLDYLAEAYTRTLLPAGMPLPAVLLQTNEGRLLFASLWTAGSAAQLAARLDEAFPVGAAVSAAGSP